MSNLYYYGEPLGSTVENQAPRHRKPFTLKSLGWRAIGNAVREQAAAAASFIARQYDKSRTEQDNHWESAYGWYNEDRRAVQAGSRDLVILDSMLAAPYTPDRLERAEHHFVDGMISSIETVAAAGRMALGLVGRHRAEAVGESA